MFYRYWARSLVILRKIMIVLLKIILVLLDLLVLFYVHECFACLSVCAAPACSACGGQKRTLDFLELELGLLGAIIV